MVTKEHRLFRHKKSNKLYWMLNNSSVNSETLEDSVVYCNVDPYTKEEKEQLSKALKREVTEDRITWVRPFKMFYDGRFEPVINK